MKLQNRLYLVPCTLILLVLSTGCGSDDSLQGLEIKGTVTLDNVPLPTGAITFIPLEQGTPIGTTIQDGTYFIDSTNGALAGEYKVEIDSSQSTGKKVQGSIGETFEEEFKNLIPEKYNRKSVLKVLITEEGDHIHDFEITGKP